MKLGIVDMIGLAATLIFAIPVANFGVNRLIAGETLMGGGLIVVAIAMVLIPHYFMDPKTIMRKLVGGLLPQRLRSEEPSVTDNDQPPNQ